VKRALLVLLVLLPACGTNVAFKQDHRVKIVFPRNRQKVTLPMTVRWTVKDFDGTFGVLVDRAPQPPGEPLTWFARNDKSCQRLPTCPDDAYLAKRDVYGLSTTEFPIQIVRPPPTNSKGKDIHEVNIVLLDRQGRRIGDTAFNVEFEVPRRRL
jgi:hypothetical protein